MNSLIVAAVFAAVPAAAAPDYAVMRECSPERYAKFAKMSGYEKEFDADKLAAKLEVFNAMLDVVASDADSVTMPGAGAPPLPASCALDDAKIKDEVYGGLAELRRKINDKASASLPEGDKEPSRNLTAIEAELDGAMGERKSPAELRSKLRSIAGKVGAAENGAPESVAPRIQRLKVRIGAVINRLAENERNGIASFNGEIPADVRERGEKGAAEARKRAGGMKGFSFGDKVDDLSGLQTAEGREAAAGGAGRSGVQGAGGDPAAVGAAGAAAPGASSSKKARAALAVDTAEIQEDSDPDEPGSSVLTEAVKNSAVKPLGGAIAPAGADEADSYDARKARAARAMERIQNMPTQSVADRAEKASAFQEALDSVPMEMSQSKGEGRVVLVGKGMRREYTISGYKVLAQRGQIEPEEEATVDAVLADMRRMGK